MSTVTVSSTHPTNGNSPVIAAASPRGLGIEAHGLVVSRGGRRLLDNVSPQAEFDSSNNLYVLHLIGMRAYVLTKVSPSGEFGGQVNYSAPKTRPTLRKVADGSLQIIGGRRDSVAQTDTPVEPPKLSARPPGFPKE